MSKDIFLTNNLTNKKEKFVPLDKSNIRNENKQSKFGEPRMNA